MLPPGSEIRLFTTIPSDPGKAGFVFKAHTLHIRRRSRANPDQILEGRRDFLASSSARFGAPPVRRGGPGSEGGTAVVRPGSSAKGKTLGHPGFLKMSGLCVRNRPEAAASRARPAGGASDYSEIRGAARVLVGFRSIIRVGRAANARVGGARSGSARSVCSSTFT